MPKTAYLVAFLSFLLVHLEAESALTIYNQNFAVVRDTVPIDLKKGLNTVTFTDITSHLEPDSVILRDPSGQTNFRILEQNYRNDPVSQELLLSLFEGKTINFLIKQVNKPDETVQGKIIRSGYAPNLQTALQRYGEQFYQSQMNNPAQPIIEVNGQIQFGLPGQPIFPSLGDDTILKPMISWKLAGEGASTFKAELAYVTSGMSWQADYNIVAPESGDLIDLVGWITMDNQSGKTFSDAKIKLMAGDVNKIQNQVPSAFARTSLMAKSVAPPAVSEKAFDEYHLYSLPYETTLHDGESKQVEFVRAAGVKSNKIYVYDGLKVDWNRYGGWSPDNVRENKEIGTDSNTKVSVLREFKNSTENQLGLALPKGRVRFYKQDGSQLEFTGENEIDHTPKDEVLKIYTGDAFDLVGERERTNLTIENSNNWIEESFEIKLRNHKKESVEIRVVEHLFRWTNWVISQNTDPFLKTDAQEMEFRVQLKPDEEKVIAYKVHYSW